MIKMQQKSWCPCEIAEVISLYTSGSVKTRENLIPMRIISKKI